MNYPPREVPLHYADLRDAVNNGVFPAERHWIDFKRELYPAPQPPGGPQWKPKSNAAVHEELARDLASLGPQGGFLIFGVDEDKARHTFTVVDMPLPVQLDQTIDQIARDRITPPLTAIPTPIPNPNKPDTGLLVVEVPESADAPHMVNGVYYGRSETGKIQLDDAAVERLIQRRGKSNDRLHAAMATTVAADTEPDTEPAHSYFTALPTQSWPGLFLEHTRDHPARTNFIGLVTGFGNDFARQDGARSDQRAVGDLRDTRRTQHPRGASFHNYPLRTDPGGVPRRLIGLEDDGTVRFIDLAAGTCRNGDHPADAERKQRGYPPISTPGNDRCVVYDEQLWWYTLDMVRLVGRLCELHRYRGSWLLGAELHRTLGRWSSLRPSAGCDTDELSNTRRASAKELIDKPRDVAAELIRPLFRDLGSEAELDQLRQRVGPDLPV
jgi:hypothetical protein